MLDHYDPKFPEGTEFNDFKQDLIEGYQSLLESMGMVTEAQIEELIIAGEPAIRLRQPGTNESDPPRNDYTFMHGELLFQISITHFDGTEDPALGNQFLSSITFHSP